MGFLPKWRIQKSTGEHHIVDVSEKDGVRSMHLGSETVQSSMRISAPDDLELGFMCRYASASRAQRELGWSPRYTFQETVNDQAGDLRAAGLL